MSNEIMHARLRETIVGDYEVRVFSGEDRRFISESFKLESYAIVWLQEKGFRLVNVNNDGRELWFVKGGLRGSL